MRGGGGGGGGGAEHASACEAGSHGRPAAQSHLCACCACPAIRFWVYVLGNEGLTDAPLCTLIYASRGERVGVRLLQGDYGCHAFYCASHNVKRDELRVMVIPFTLEDLRYTNSAHRRKIES